MNSKELRFQFVLDESSFQRVNRALDQILTKSKELAKVLSNINSPGGLLSGGSVGRPGASAPVMTGAGQQRIQTTSIGGAILKDAEAFQKMAQSSKTALGAMTEAVRRGIREQESELSRIDRIIGKINDKYNIMNERQASVAQKRLLNLSAARNSAEEQLRDLRQAETGLSPSAGTGAGALGAAAPSTPAASYRGLFSPVGNGNINLGNPMGMIQSMMGSTGMGAVLARSLGMIGGGAMAVANQSQGWNNAMLDVRAQRGDIIMPELRRTMKGDISDALARRELAGYSSEDRIEALRRSGSVEARGLAAISATAKTAAGLFTGGTAAGMSDAALDNKTMERVVEAQEAIKRTSDFQMGIGRGYQYMNDTQGSRITSARILGAGFYERKGFGGTPANVKDSYTGLAARLHSQGFSTEELAASTVQARGLGGRQFANSFAGTMMSASAAGYGQVGDVLAAAARGGGLRGARGLVQGALGGGIDATAGLQLGQTLFGFDPRGNVSGRGALLAAQQGFGFNGSTDDFNSVARIGLGMQAGDSLAKGFDAYQQGRNIVGAIGAMPGATTYAQDSLAGRTSFKELLELASGGTSARSQAYGYGKNEAKSQLEVMGGSIFDRFVDQGGNDNVSKAIRGLRSSGGDLTEYMAGLGKTAKAGGKKGAEARKQLEAMGVYMSDEMGIDTEAGIGLAEMYSGVKGLDKGKLKSGKIPGAGIDDATKAQRKLEAEQMVESAKQFVANFGKIMDTMKTNPEAQKALVSFGALATSAEQATTRLYRLAGVPETDFEKGRGSTTVTAVKNSSSGFKATAGLFSPAAGAAAGLVDIGKAQQSLIDKVVGK